MVTGSKTFDSLLFAGMVVASKMMWNRHAFGTWW